MAELEIVHADAIPTSGQDLRTGYEGLQEGVIGADDLKCVPGAGLSIDVPAGVTYIQGDAIPDQGLYRARNDGVVNTAAFELGGIPAADPTNPRLDQIIARAYDHAADASGLRKWRFEVAAGTPTAGATLDNRLGAAALAASAMRVLDFLTPAGFAGPYVAGTHFRDRRSWAQGALRRIERTSNAAGTDDYTTTSTSYVAIDGTNLSPRIECSGRPLRVKLSTSFLHTVAAARLVTDLFVDGVAQGQERWHQVRDANRAMPVVFDETIIPTPGSHVIAVHWRNVEAGTLTVYTRPALKLTMLVQELDRASADNT